MKILKITINNLASLEAETILDFTSEPLASAGIFAITGPTGAGKSTILDALCLALYARTPRYVQAKSKGIELQDSSGETISQGDPRGILRDGCTAGSATVCFIGLDGDTYEATWAVKRARLKITGRLMAYTHTLHNKSKQRDVPGTNTVIREEIERLIGLNFDQFTRSVLLAQGDFTAFMKADKEEKSALLEKLTGSQIYSEISKIIYEHYKEQTAALNNLQAKAENIELLTEAQITDIKAEISALEKQLIIHQKEKDMIDQAVNWHQVKTDLENKQQQATLIHQQALAAKQALSDTKIQLALVQKLRPLKTVQENLLSERAIYLKDSEEKATLDQQILVLSEKKQQSSRNYQQLLTQKDQQEAALRDARPLLDQARSLDTQINIADEQLTTQNKSLSDARQNKKQVEKEKKTVLQKLSDSDSKLAQAIRWISLRQDRSKIAESTDLVISRLEEAASLLQKSYGEQKMLEDLNTELESFNNQAIAVQAQIEQTNHIYLEDVQALQQLQQKLTQIDSQQLEENITALQNKQQSLERTQMLFENVEKATVELEASVQLVRENKLKIESLTVQAAEMQPKVQTLETQVTTTRQLLERAAIRNTENIEKLRSSLHENEPCPVCGSTEHPYAEGTHQDLADQLLSTLQEELSTAEQAYKAAERQYATIHSEIDFRQKQQQQLNESRASKQSVYQEAKAKWESSPFWQTLKDQPAANTDSWFEAQISNSKKALTALQENKKNYVKLMEQRELLQPKMETAKDQLQKLKDELKDLKAAIDLKTQQSRSHSSTLQEANQHLGRIQSALNDYFPSQDWFSNWQKAPEKFTQAIQQFATDWKQQQSEAEHLHSQVERFKIELEGHDRAMERAVSQLTQLEEIANQQQQKRDTLQNSRLGIFDGKPVTVIENDLSSALDHLNQQVEKARQEVEALEKNWSERRQQQAILENNLQKGSKRCQQLDQQIIHWIDAYNKANNESGKAPLDRAQVDHLLSFTEQWSESQQEKINLAEQQEITAKSKLEERTQDLENHQATCTDQRSLDTLITLQTTATAQLEEKKKAGMERQLRLENNQKNVKKQGTLQKQIEQQIKIYEGWSALNSLIGSRDGRKFREIAQQYTLDLLLGYANKHLYVLSKRYVLDRIQHSLAIQVIDQDMADEVRSVYSLSGGESFLVSLALALGLASLSSQRLKVESLFIDEGFGSLDPTTLSVAMDALERLQDQGRKVGVISHVQEMTERIAVQIQVHKKPSGKSNISVESLA